ncbi:MAG: hypothetical protein WCO51_01325 [bacterium]
MKQRFTLWTLIGSSVALMAAAMLIGGCGGGGGAGAAPPGPSASFLGLLPVGQKGAKLVGSEKCGECHNVPDEPALAKSRVIGGGVYDHWQNTVHALKGVGCESCHGPGSTHVASAEAHETEDVIKSNILIFPNITSAIVCEQCHSGAAGRSLVQHDEWVQSKHREMVADAGAGGSSTCMRCHNSEFKVEIVDRGLIGTVFAGQLALFAQRAKDELAAGDPQQLATSATCSACHDPHDPTGYMVDEEGKDLQIRRAPFVAPDDTAQLALIGPGASVDQYTSFNHICAQCHNGRGADGRDAKLTSSTSRPGMHDSPQFNMLIGLKDSAWEASGGPIVRFTAHAEAEDQCIHCHMIDGPGQHSFVANMEACAPCHTPTDATNRRSVTQDDITTKLLALRQRLDNWGISIDGNRLHWQYSSAEFGGPADQSNTNIPLAIKRARNNYYYVVRDASFGVHNAGYARYLIDVANAQLDSLRVASVTIPVTRGRSLADIRAQMVKEAKKGGGE